MMQNTLDHSTLPLKSLPVSRQSSLPPVGSLGYQFVKLKGRPVDAHTHPPSENSSVPSNQKYQKEIVH